MRYLIVSIAAVFLMAAGVRAQNPLDKPAQPTGTPGRTGNSPLPPSHPPANNGDKVMEAATAPKVGLEQWVVREGLRKSFIDTGKPTFWVSFHRVEKVAPLAPGSLNQQRREVVPRPKQPWSMSREEASSLMQILYKFVEWSDVADKNHVVEMNKEIGKLPSLGQTLWFYREKEAGPPKSWLTVGYSTASRPTYWLSAADGAALTELIDKLAGLEDQLLGRAAPPPTPKNSTDSLFK